MIDNLKYNKDSYDIDYMYNEIVKRNIYERFYEVCDNDVVVDIGSNIGIFPISIIDKNFKVCYCVEPSDDEFYYLKLNTSKKTDKFVLSNELIGSYNGISYLSDNEGCRTLIDSSDNIALSVKFGDYLKKNNIDKINFLKMDCEGSEWDIIVNENIDLFDNIEYIAGEFHKNITINGNSVEFPLDKIKNSIKILEDKFYVKYTSLKGDVLNNTNIFYHRQFLFYAINKNVDTYKLEKWLDNTNKTVFEFNYIDGKSEVWVINSDKYYDVEFVRNDNQIVYRTRINYGYTMTTLNSDSWKIIIYENGYKILEEIVSNENPIIVKKKSKV